MRTFKIYQFTNMPYSINCSCCVYITSHWLDLYLEVWTCWLLSTLINGLCVLLNPACINSNFGLRAGHCQPPRHSSFYIYATFLSPPWYQTPSSTKTGHHWKEWRRVTPYWAWVTSKRLQCLTDVRCHYPLKDRNILHRPWALWCTVWNL